MKIIFLDIDGVLNCEHGFKDKSCTKRDEFGHLFYPPSKSLLNDLIDKTDAKIVISSTWRHDGLDEMQKMWKHRKMAGDVIDITPSIRSINLPDYIHNDINKEIKYSLPRGIEIDVWLKWNKFNHIFWSKEKQLEYINNSGIENYIIIDDDSDMLHKQKNHFVHVKPSPRNKKGFNVNNYKKALKILNKTIIDLQF